MDVIGLQAMHKFLGVKGEITQWEQQDKQCTLVLGMNPLSEFVMLPQCYKNSLWYSNVLCGLIMGSLEMVNIKVKATFAKDVLRGDESTEIKVQLIEIMKDVYEGDD